MSERLLQGRVERAVVVAMVSSVALVGACSAESSELDTTTTTMGSRTSSESPTPSMTLENAVPTTGAHDKVYNYNIPCHQSQRGDVIAECQATETGVYNLYKGSYKKPGNEPLASVIVQAKGGNVSLVPRGAYTAECTQAYVTFLPLPKDGTGKEYEIFKFDICGPVNIPGKEPSVTPTFRYM
ncbi:MAG: hypothetical protein ABIR37_00865 [Candidatus Saccharimonadales bacterium]